MPDAAAIAKLGTEPIPGALPTGESARYDTEFATLEAELTKLENPAGGTIDWKIATDAAVTLLSGRSKDLLIAAYLTRSLWQLDGAAGLATGMSMIRALLDTFWEGIHPQRPKARRGALEWIGDRMAILIDPASVAEADLPHLASVKQTVDAIWAASAQRFDGEDCGLAALRRRLDEVLAGQSAGQSAGTSGDAFSGAPGEIVQSSSRSASGPVSSRAMAIARLGEVAAYFRSHEPHSPVGLLLSRAIGWSEMSFEQVFAELLKDKQEARSHVFDVLGIKGAPTSE
jgi:type VI secretion system ImpA/VasJ family protein